MAKNLLIVESPAKAKTIEGFLGPDFEVKSSYGHIRDLPKNDKAIDVEHDFAPHYEITDDKMKVVADLTKAAKKAEVVWLATDEDREGEAISWHLAEALKLDVAKTNRIVFHEITKSAIQHAVDNPRRIDMHLVDAQQARRILDRLVGFELSPILWRKVKPSLSAGRVQSVAVRLIVEREREIDSFNVTSNYKVVAFFNAPNDAGQAISFKAELPERIKKEEDAQAFLEKLVGANYKVRSVEKKPANRTPSAPFTTSTLQQEASRKLGFSVAQTMLVAQKLYESGKITYMRTDSVSLSDTAVNAAAEEIIKTFGAKYSDPHQFVTKSKGAQEAHEAIRPTYMNVSSLRSNDEKENRLYDLIWKRTIASQMADAKIEKTIATIIPDKTNDEFVATGEVILFDGFLKVYMESSDDEDEETKEGLLPPMKSGQQVAFEQMTATEKFSQAPPRYTEASLVKKLENLGIGRPSTYAPTISTIQKRGYVEKTNKVGKERKYQVLTLANDKISTVTKKEMTGAEKAKLFPTDIGGVVNDFLVTNFKEILDYNFTADVEKKFDDIAEGTINWTKMMRNFYDPFHKTVETAQATSERATGERLLGTDPKTGKEVLVRIGRFGPLVQLKSDQEGEKIQYANLKAGQRIETISLDEALDLFKLPRNIGEIDGKEVVIGIGKYGPYVKYDSGFTSLNKEDDPYTITLERATELINEKKNAANAPSNLGSYEGIEITSGKGRFGPFIKHSDKYYSLKRGEDFSALDNKRAIEIIEEKRKSDAEKVIKSFEENKEVQVLNGRFGPYIAVGKLNVKIPKDKEPKELTLEECLELSKDQNPTKKKTTRKATTAKKAKAK